MQAYVLHMRVVVRVHRTQPAEYHLAIPRVFRVQRALQHRDLPQRGIHVLFNVLVDNHLYVVYEDVITDADGRELDEHGEEPDVGEAARVGEDGRPEEVREALVEAVAREEQVVLQEVYQHVEGDRGGGSLRGLLVLLRGDHASYLVGESCFILIDDSLVSHLGQIQMRNVQVEYLDIELPTLAGIPEGPRHLLLHHFVIG